MPTVAFIALEEFDRGNADAAQALLENLRAPARFQIIGHWQEIRRNCQRRVTPEPERRRVNGLNVEASGAALDRCLLQSPDGLGLRWWLSGGSVLAYGICTLANCPLATAQERKTAERGGTMLVGWSRWQEDSDSIHHGKAHLVTIDGDKTLCGKSIESWWEVRRWDDNQLMDWAGCKTCLKCRKHEMRP